MTNNTYTIFARWELPEAFIEEVDIEAPTADEARAGAIKELEENYDPGWSIIGIERREGYFC